MWTPDGLQKFDTIGSIIKAYMKIRMDLNAKRLAYMIDRLTQESHELSEKARFIRMVVEEKLIIFKRAKKSIIKDLIELGFKDPESLLNITTVQYTNESIHALLEKSRVASSEVVRVSKIDPIQLMKNDLDSL